MQGPPQEVGDDGSEYGINHGSETLPDDLTYGEVDCVLLAELSWFPHSKPSRSFGPCTSWTNALVVQIGPPKQAGLASRRIRSKLNPPLDVLPMPQPCPTDHDDRRWEASGLLGVQEALAGLPADQLQDLARADEIGGVDLLALGPARHGPGLSPSGRFFGLALT